MRFLAALKRVGMTATLVGLAAALLALAAPSVSTAQPVCTISWDGGARGAWHEPANWTGDALPGPADHVCIPTSVTVEVSQAVDPVLTVQSQGTLEISGGSLSLTDTLTLEGSTTTNLTQSGGTLGGAGTLTVSGSFTWTGGTHADAGSTVIASGGTLSATESFLLLDDGRTLRIDSGATATMVAAARIFMQGSSRIENAGSFNANGDEAFAAGIFTTGGDSQLVHNTGSFTRNGTGRFVIGVPFDNDGTVEVSAGTLTLLAGDVGTTTGSFNGSGTDGLFEFQSGMFTLATGASLSGRIALTTATLNVSGSVAHSAGGVFTQSGGTLGGAGTLTVSGSFTWTGGTHADAGSTVIASGGTLSATESFLLLDDGRTLRIDSGATATMAAAARIFMQGSSRIENAGSFNANGDEAFAAGIFTTGGDSQLVHNTGSFTRNGTGRFVIGVPFDNDGTVEVSAGTLTLASGDAGGPGTGSYSAASGGIVDFSGGELELSGPISGAGTIRISAGTVNFGGTYNVGGTTEITGGVANFTSAASTTNLTQSGGTLGGAGTLTVSGSFTWTGGTHADAGSTVIASGGTLSATESFLLLDDGRTLRIDSGATATMAAAARIFMQGSSRIENAGSFNANGDEAFAAGIFTTGGDSQLVHNTGSFTRNGTGRFVIGVPFDNDGTVEVSAGTLTLLAGDVGTTTGSFNGSGTDGLFEFQSGMFTLATGASLSGRIALTTATLNVSGSVAHSAGGVFTQSGGTLGGAGTLTVSGSFTWTGGTHADAGSTVIASGGTLSATESFLLLDDGRTLRIDSGATATMAAAARIFMQGSSRIENAGSFNANGDEAFAAGIFTTGGDSQLVHNTGSFTRNGTGRFVIGVPFDNDGTVEVSAGILGVSSYTQSASGTLHLHVGGLAPGTGFTQLDATGAVSLDGTLRITTESGFAPALGQSFRILNANPRTGTFSSIQGTDAGGGLAYTVQYDALGATLVVDDAPTLSIGDVSVSEGDSGERSANFEVTLSRAAAQAVTVDFSTADGSASAPADYTAASGQLTIAAGQTTGQIAVAVQGDTLDEPDETFLVNLTNAVNATISDAQATGTILDDDAPTLSIGDVSVSEGDSGERSANFEVTLSRAAAQAVTVDFSTADGSASAPADYTAASGQLTIAAGQTTGQIAVAVQGDTLDEPDETFLVNLTNAVNATISDAQATGTILDDDAPTLSIGDVSVSEGDSGERSANFVVTLSRAAAQAVTVDFSTADGSASAPADYTAASGQLTIAAGQTTGQIAVAVQGDTLDEPDETFLVNLTNAVNATISDAQATGTILDDDAPTLSIGDVSVSEGDSGERSANFEVTLSRAAAQAVTVDFSTADGSASAPADYTAASGQLTIAAGQTTGQIAVAVQGDTLDEPDETFLVNLTNAVNATISDAQATGTILDDDAPVVVPGCEVSGKGVIKAANGPWATFRFDVESGPRPRGRARYRDRGPARPLKLKSSQITEVTVSADERHATILGKGKINRAGSFDFAIEVDEVLHAPDSFHIRLDGGYDSGKQRILKGDVDIECEEDDDDRHDKARRARAGSALGG